MCPWACDALGMLQEWWGITDIVKKQAELVAAQGPYRVLVPDLYKGKIGVTAEEAAHVSAFCSLQRPRASGACGGPACPFGVAEPSMRGHSQLFNHLDFHAAVAEIGQALKYLKETGSPKVGITGERELVAG